MNRDIPWLQDLVLLVCLCAGDTFAAKQKHGIFTARTHLTMRVNDFAACADWSQVIIAMSRNAFTGKGEYAHDFDWNMIRPFPAGVSVRDEITKCSEAVSSNTCEYFKTLQFDNMDPCSVLSMKNGFWSGYMDHTTPKLLCPIKAGLYRTRNSTLDVDWFDKLGFKLEDYIWINNISIYQTRSLIACIVHQSQFFRIRI